MRLVLALGVVVSLALPAAAPAPPPPYVPPPAVGFRGGEPLAAFPTADGLRAARGEGFRPYEFPFSGPDLAYGRWWVEGGYVFSGIVVTEYFRPNPPAPGIAFERGGERGGGGTPVLPADAHFDVDGGAFEDVVFAWEGGDRKGVVGGVSLSDDDLRVPGPMPLKPAVAVAPMRGGALIVGGGAGGELMLRERLPDRSGQYFLPPTAITAFGPLAPVPGATGLERYDVALASDGSVLLAGVREGQVVALRRRDGEWSASVSLGPANEFAEPRVGLARGGAGVVAFNGSDSRYRVVDLPADGSAPSVGVTPGYVAFGGSLSVRDDGAAAVDTPAGVFAREPGGTFAPVVAPAGTHAVAYGREGLFIGTGSYQGYFATYGGQTFRLGDFPYPYTGPPTSERRPVTVAPGALRAAGALARVPLRCPSGPQVVCVGKLDSRRFLLTGGTGRYVELPVARDETRITFAITQDGRARRFERSLARSAPRCPIPHWARTLARAEGSRVGAAVPVRGEGRAIVCGPSGFSRVLELARPTAAAIRDDRLVVAGATEAGEIRLLKTRLPRGAVRSRPLLRAGDREVLRVLLGGGATVIVDRIDDQIRIRQLGRESGEIVRYSEGILPGSVRIDAGRLLWRHRGATVEAAVPLKPPAEAP